MRWRARIVLLALALFVCPLVWANQRAQGWCQLGAQNVVTVGINSTNVVQQTFPSCTVTIYITNTLTLASIFSDNSGTVKSNPFTASATGVWFFYAANGRYDVSLTGGGIVGTITYPDILLSDFGATGAITTLNTLTAATQTFATGTSGTDFNIVSATSTHTFNLPTASGTNRGLLASADWTTFNGKQAPLTFTAPLVNTAGNVAITFPFTVTQGGTNATTQTTAFNNLSPLTTKGDFLTSNGSNNVRVAIGTDTWVPFADSTQGVGWAWKACAFCQFTSPLGVANGGLGLTAGTSGGIPAFTGSTTIASSGVLLAGGFVLGGGAGVAPSTSGAATQYNGQTLSGQGVPVILYTIALQTAQAATVGPTTAVASAGVGTYEACYYSVITQAASSSSSLTPTFNWNDGSARVSTSTVAGNAPQFQAYTGNVAGTVLTGCAVIYSAAAQAITYTFTYSSTGGTVMQYSYAVTVKRIL